MSRGFDRIYLSPPHIGDQEKRFVEQAFTTNWIAPLGPNVDQFEQEFAAKIGVSHAAALNSGTAALHLAMRLLGVAQGDEVLVSTLTFAASVNPIIYEGARPVFVDSEQKSWNMDPLLLAEMLRRRVKAGKRPKAVIIVHLYGQCANLAPIISACDRYGIPLVEDAAEALGSTYDDQYAGTFGRIGVFSFNGNKIITTSGGGMLVSHDEYLVARAKKLASQARDEALHYQHSEIGYNYRLSNVLAGIGRGQLAVLEDRIASRRHNFEIYKGALGEIAGIDFMPDAAWGRHTRWLTCLTVNPKVAGVDRDLICAAMEHQNIEARPVWKPMHLQPVFAHYDVGGGEVAERLFEQGMCLPSGSALSVDQLARVIEVFREACSL